MEQSKDQTIWGPDYSFKIVKPMISTTYVSDFLLVEELAEGFRISHCRTIVLYLHCFGHFDQQLGNNYACYYSKDNPCHRKTLKDSNTQAVLYLNLVINNHYKTLIDSKDDQSIGNKV